MTHLIVLTLRAAALVAVTRAGPPAARPSPSTPAVASATAPGPGPGIWYGPVRMAPAARPAASTPAVASATAAVPGPGIWYGPVTMAPADTPVARPRAIEHSDAYYTRLTIHRVGSYAMLPLFAAEYALGQNLLTSQRPASWVRPAHRVAAYGVAAVFTVNTVTGVWNLWDSRRERQGRARRWIHAGSMLLADAGFVATGASARQARLTLEGAHRHRNLALGSIGVSVASALFMKLTK